MNRKPMIGELIKKIQVPFAVDSVIIKESRILYNEIVSADKEPLKVLFTDVDLDIINITNAPEMLAIDPELRISGITKFLDAGKLDLSLNVPLTAKEDKMIVKGHLEAMPIGPINKMLEGPLGVRFTSGKINSIDIDFIADTRHSKGKLLFDYNDLVIQLFKDKETPNNGVKERQKWFMNAIANEILRTDNNQDSDKFVTGIIDYERPKDIAIPGYIFRSVKSGLISTFKPGTRRKAIKEENIEKREEIKKEKPKKKKSKTDKKDKTG